MNPAIIRLSKKIIIRFNEPNEDLNRMWNSINENIEDLIQRRSNRGRLNWKTIHDRYRQQFNKDASDYGEGVLQWLKYRYPESIDLTSHERELKLEMARTEIHDFTEEINSLVLHFFLITEPLLFIGHIGSRLLLGKKELIPAFQKGELIQNTFTLNLDDNYDIVEYTRIKIES
jgi:hypothetical protein